MMDEAETGDLARGRVLVVDDDDAYRAFMHLLLTDEGYDVALAPSIAAASRCLRAAPPDLVIGDLRMPGAPIFALLDLLDAEPTRAIPVIVCTGAADQLDAAKARLGGRRGEVLLKPFDIDDLLACIRRVL
jgi:two-component system, NtrC family, nitrogen regulation response regulator GlnG